MKLRIPSIAINKRPHGWILIALTAILITCLAACQQPADNPGQPKIGAPAPKNQPREDRTRPNRNDARTDTRSSASNASAPFDRHPDRLILTKHARCRMDCRHITEKEIREILDHGEINDRKSEPDAHPDPKFAIDGNTDEGQHLRIVVAVPHKDRIKESAGSVLVVVTCIELGVEWQCNCH